MPSKEAIIFNIVIALIVLFIYKWRNGRIKADKRKMWFEFLGKYRDMPGRAPTDKPNKGLEDFKLDKDMKFNEDVLPKQFGKLMTEARKQSEEMKKEQSK